LEVTFPPNYVRRPGEAESPPTPGDPPLAAPPARCVSLGVELVGLRQCQTCQGNVRLKEFACSLGLGVAGRAVPTIDCGPQCRGYEPVKA
jgi:hypothetical protein